MKYLLVTFAYMFAIQAHAEGLDAAFEAALANSEKDHQEKQVAFQVSPEQVEKATFKRVVNPHVEVVPADLRTDMGAFKENPIEAPQPKVEVNPETTAGDDLAGLGKELSDIR